MLITIRYIFESGKDLRLYYDPDGLLTELIESGFPIREAVNAIDWFSPIIDTEKALFNSYRGKSIRLLDCVETKHLPEGMFNSIIKEEQKGFINAYQRDLLIDRLSRVADGACVSEVEDIKTYLIKHFNNHTSMCIQNLSDALPVNWTSSVTLH